MRGAFVVVVLLAACDPLPKPISGVWRVDRSVPAQPAGCRALGVGAIEVTIDGAAKTIAVTGSTLEDYDQEVTDTTASFVTEDFGFSDELSRTIVIVHDLVADEATHTISGTGFASGDGDDLGCMYDLVLTDLDAP
jgi:hypothetical protein